MADPINFVGGTGGTVGPTLATLPRLINTGNVYYVSSTTGSDAASPRGRDRARPLATTAQAITNSGDGDWIVYLANHAETFSSAVNFAGGYRIFISEGQGSSRARLSRGSNITLFNNASGAGTWFVNLYFPAATSGGYTAGRIATSSATQMAILNCYFEHGAGDTGPGVNLAGGGGFLIKDTYFVSTATLPSAQPTSAIDVSGVITDLTLDTVTLDGGASGWSQPFAFNGTANCTRLRGWNIDLLNDSDMTITTGSAGFISVRNTSGSARVVWP